MHTLEQLRSGELAGVKRLTLRADLEEFPHEIFSLADSLEVLDLSGNRLSRLPANLHQLKHLRVLFCSDNLFTELPRELQRCPALSMIGFKSNRIVEVPAESLPPTTRWLILTNNRIARLPASIGSCRQLQKVALAGNQLEELPPEMAHCQHLELLRVSANRLRQLPQWLLDLPRLSWLAFAGNPFCCPRHPEGALPVIHWEQLELQQELGEGASGNIYRALWRSSRGLEQVALKVFKGEVTSDGFPGDELQAAIAAAGHPALPAVVGTLEGHPQGRQGLLMELIPAGYYNLGLPPSLASCTRDTFPEGTVFASTDISKIAGTVASLALHLHQKGLMHGDLYAHNALIDANANTLLGDFGAASFYDTGSTHAAAFERIEARAFGCLLDDLLAHVDAAHRDLPNTRLLAALRSRLMSEQPGTRPLFDEVVTLLKSTEGPPVI